MTDIIERAEAELYNLGEYGEPVNPTTFAELVSALKAARAENIRLSAENSRLRFMDRGL